MFWLIHFHLNKHLKVCHQQQGRAFWLEGDLQGDLRVPVGLWRQGSRPRTREFGLSAPIEQGVDHSVGGVPGPRSTRLRMLVAHCRARTRPDCARRVLGVQNEQELQVPLCQTLLRR